MNYFQNGSVTNYWLTTSDLVVLPSDLERSLFDTRGTEIRIHLPDQEPIRLGTLSRLIAMIQGVKTPTRSVQLFGDSLTLANLRTLGVLEFCECVEKESA